jgi:hypothetical protein
LRKLSNKSKGFNPQKHCCCCGCNGGIKKWIIHFSYNRKAKVCVFCIEKLGGIENVRIWLENNSIYSKNGKLIGFKRGDLNE